MKAGTELAISKNLAKKNGTVYAIAKRVPMLDWHVPCYCKGCAKGKEQDLH